eukprot:scaffold384032_cov36-Prasinocladus_malaysianus.AAC.1
MIAANAGRQISYSARHESGLMVGSWHIFERRAAKSTAWHMQVQTRYIQQSILSELAELNLPVYALNGHVELAK